MHWFWHITGIDTQQSRFYDFWSGIATQGTIIGAGVAVYRKHNCHRRWCLRIGHFEHQDGEIKRFFCHRHHPAEPARVV